MSRVEKSPDVVTTELEDGAVLLNLDTRLYYSLNDTATELWRALEAGSEPAELSARLQARFEIDGARADSVVQRFVRELERERLVVPAGERAVGGWETGSAPAADGRRPFVEPELIQHDEPLHEIATSPLDPQLPLAE